MSRRVDGQADGLRFELKRIRKEMGYNQLLMAEILGVSVPFLSMMENGRKPLNQNALRLIDEAKDRKCGYTPTHKPKNAEKVNKEPLKTNKLRPRFSVKIKVSDIPAKGRDWVKWWFSNKHPRCEACASACKQSVYVGLWCPQYKAKEN